MTERGRPSLRVTERRELLSVMSLSTHFDTPSGTLRAVDDVAFAICEGETVGLVGESGSGKSMTALSMVGLVPRPGRVVAGSIRFGERDLAQLNDRELQRIRGREIGFIFQDPMTALSPAFTVGEQIAETLRNNLGLTKRQAGERAVSLLGHLGLPRPRDCSRRYPHELSGGMRQRVMIAIAISCEPSLIIADEPTTALDVTVQAQIVELLLSLRDELDTAMLLITHDLGLAAGTCDRVNVMYGGRIVESGPATELFDHPQMPYSAALLACLPNFDAKPGVPLTAIEGSPPVTVNPPDQCRFHDRCRFAREPCLASEPRLTQRASPSHLARCWGTEGSGWIQ